MFKIFEIITEIFGWLRIVLSPTLIGIFIAFVLYYNYPKPIIFYCSIAIALLGFIIGIIWATKVWKKTGTIHFLSRIMATPELDKPQMQEDEEKN